jgi:hypothetical protein
MLIQEVIGDEDIPDGNQTRYQEIAERILAAVSELGSERS